MTFEVQTWTLCDDWINTWSVINDDISTPETFDTEADAQAALDEFLAEIQEEIDMGIRAPDEGYSEDDFRIVQVQP